MVTVKLVPHHEQYAERIFQLSSDPQVNEHLSFKDDSVENTKWFINHIINEEKEGKAISRIITNEENEVIGITSLININHDHRYCHMGSWIGKEYWGKGYNQKAKEEILKIAFDELKLDVVILGARTANIRSQKAQEKLPYITLNVENLYPEEHQKLEEKEKVPCVLNCVTKENFFKHTQSLSL